MVGLNSRGAIVLREKVSRGRIASRLANLPPCLIGIEAELATHHVARELARLGHDVKQVPPTYAKPLVVAPPPPTPSRIGGGMLMATQAVKSDYSPQIPLRLMNKDFGLILELAGAVGAEVPATQAAFEVNAAQSAQG